MKKTAILLSVLLLTGTLAACGEKTENGSSDTEQTPNAQGADITEESGGSSSDTETAELKDITVEDYITLNGEYIGLDISIPPKAEVTDAQTEELALSAYNSGLTVEDGILGRAVEIGDLINLDYSGALDGVAFAGGTARDQQLEIGSGAFISGFEDGLVGVMTGETVDLNLTFPEGYKNPELKGQEVVFTVTVNYIYPSSKVEMKDEVIDKMTEGEFETVDAFLEYCREYLEYEAEYDYTLNRENAVIKTLDTLFSCSEVPRALQNNYAANIAASMEYEAAQYGLDVYNYFYYFYETDADTYLEKASEARARQCMMLQYIANRENLHVSDEELEESLKSFAEENGVASVDELLLNTDREYFREYFMIEKVLEFIIENGHVTEE